tara:strand:- start:98 stop:277 length:180 start_codon:yes stop_codon:yes gene_type:complete
MSFVAAHIIGDIVPNLIAFVLFFGAIGYFAAKGKMARMFGWKKKIKNNVYQFTTQKCMY